MNQLEIIEVHKIFGNKKVLDGVSFNCRKGEIIGLFGSNGSGKSTLFKAIMGAIKVNSINIKIDGDNIKSSKIIPGRKIGFLPQDSFLPKEMKVRDVIPLMFQKGDEQDKIFYSPGVSGFHSNRVGNLSSGQLKYLEVLLLAHLPQPFLLLDEPFSMVEPQYIEKIQELLLSLKASKGLVITDHYYRSVLKVASRSVILSGGKLFEVEDDQDLIAHRYLKNA